MFTPPREKRVLLDICLAFALGVVLLVLSLTINFQGKIQTYFGSPAVSGIAALLINSVCFWVAVALSFAFVRWYEWARGNAELENIVSSISPNTLLVIAPDRTITRCSMSASRMFGYEVNEILGRKTDLLYYDRRTGPRQSSEVRDALARDGFHVGQAKGKRKDGTAFPLEIITGELRDNRGAVLVLKDISERVQAEERHIEMENRLQQKQKLESLGVLAGTLAHDFNNLLAGILGHADLALGELPPDSPLRENLDSIVESGRHAADLCREMLAYSGHRKLVLEPIDLNTLIRETHPIVAAAARNAKLIYDLPPALPSVMGDISQLRQILVNLVTNASDAIGTGGGDITIRTGILDGDAEFMAATYFDETPPAGRFVFFAVKDTGAGMDEATKQKIFDPFFTTKAGGRGLGLAAVHGTILAHHGALRLESQPGAGAEFTILLPLSGAPVKERKPVPAPTQRMSGGTVLVIDDNKAVVDLSSRMLRRMGFTVLAATEGQEGLAVYRGFSHEILFVLLDVTMPGMDGRQVMQDIRRVNPEAKILLTSGYEQEEAAADLLAQPSVAFIHKPYEMQSLSNRISELLGRGR